MYKKYILVLNEKNDQLYILLYTNSIYYKDRPFTYWGFKYDSLVTTTNVVIKLIG